MKILLVSPRIYLKRQVPLGIAYIAAYLRENGYKVTVFDPPPWEKNASFYNTLKKFNPDIVGLSCTTPQLIEGLKLADIIKGYNASIKVVFGGVHPSSDPQKLLEFKNIDYVIVGEGEGPFLQLCRQLEKEKGIKDVPGLGYRTSGSIKINPNPGFQGDLDKLPMPARDLFPMRWYSQRSTIMRGMWLSLTNLMSSRGCPWNCIFCASNTVFGRKFRAHSVDRVVDEVERVVERYHLDGVYFSDDTFAVNMKRAINICNEIVSRKLDIQWRIQLRADTISDELLNALSRAGCIQIEFGVESGSDKVLKNINKRITTRQISDAFRLCKKYNIRTMAHFMINNPGEFRTDIEKTRKFAHKIRADFTEFHICTPYPGTEIYKMAIEKNWLKKSLNYEDFLTDMDKVNMEINFSSEELVSIRDKLRKEFIREKIVGYLKQPKFIKDMFLFNITHPLLPFRIMGDLILKRNIEHSLRIMEREQNSRRFP